MNSIWRKNFDIKRVDYNICCETMPGFGGLNHLTVGKNILQSFLLVIENLDLVGAYARKNELRELIELTIKTIFENPDRVDKVHKQAIELNQKYFDYAESLRKIKLGQMAASQLMAKHKKLFNLQYQSHCWSLPTSWYIDTDGEDFSKRLISLLEQKIKALRVDSDAATAFSVLTTPNPKKPSLGQQEEIQSWQMLDWIQKTPKLRHWFASHTTEELITSFPSLPQLWKNKILRHHYQWCWTPYTYIGPAYELDYYLEVWRGLIHEDADTKASLKSIKTKALAVQKQRTRLVKALKLSPQEKHWFDIATDIVWLKGFRKDCYFHGFYVLDLLLAEVAKRGGLSLLQAKYLLPKELPWVLKGKDMANVANERMKFSVIFAKTLKGKNINWTDKGITVLTGIKAKRFLKKQKFEKIEIISTNQIAGTCACPGAAQGRIKIVNVPEEMGKMNQGDIMLAHTTFPSLVPAMKKAAAIITEDGGITCHAAIVARELQTPCVVGCKNATSIFKDGDMVEVDANKGIIKKIK